MTTRRRRGEDGISFEHRGPAATRNATGTARACGRGEIIPGYTEAGIGDAWTPRELRTSFVSLMSHPCVSSEEIARPVGHASTRTTEIVYRRELRPVITTGAEIMDQLFIAT